VAEEEGATHQQAATCQPDSPCASLSVEQHGQTKPDQQDGVEQGERQGGPVEKKVASHVLPISGKRGAVPFLVPDKHLPGMDDNSSASAGDLFIRA
jgi:hypothetical protein